MPGKNPSDDAYVLAPETPRPSSSTSPLDAPFKPFREQPNPLATAWLPSVLSVFWLQPLVSVGAKRILEKEDVWPSCPEDECRVLEERFRAHHDPLMQRGALRFGMAKVALALVKTFRREIIIIFANYLVYLTAMVLQPYIAQAILKYLADQPNMFHISSGYGLVGLMAAVSFAGVTCLNYGFFLSSRVGVNMRTVVMDVVYQKALRLSCVARQAYTTGEIVTLMSVDSERIFHCVIGGPWLLVAPLAFLVTVILIAIQFSWAAALAGAALLVLVLFGSVKLADRIGDLQAELLTIVDERVKVTSEALHGVRVMKFYAWEESLVQRVEKIRALEVALYRKFQYLNVMNGTLLILAPVFLGAVVLGIYIGVKGNLSVTEVFTLINVVNISRLAVSMFPLAIANVSQATIAYNRIDEYLDSAELDGLLTSEHKNLQMVASGVPKGSISVRGASFSWGSCEVPAVVDVSTSHEPLVEIELTPLAKQPVTLSQVNLHIEPSSLVMIVGTVGSGKSSLLSALLGEMITHSGEVDVHGAISYVGQEAWIRNSTLKDNILFEEAFDAERYAKVLECTQLALDLEALPFGDRTEIGERGINLSGGQKARISVARAVYRSNYDILILDDPLSAVDPHVAHAIFEQCIVGMAHDKTRLLVLNSHYDLLSHADQILVMRNGQIVGNGKYEEIMQHFPELRGHSEELDQLERDTIDEHEDTKTETRKAATAAKHAVADDAAAKKSSGDGPADNSQLVQEEDRVRGRVSGKTYRTYFDETGFNGLVVVFVLILAYAAGQVIRVLVDWWQAHWAKNMPRKGVDPTYSEAYYGFWYLGLIVVCSVATLGRGLLLMEVCMRSAKNLHNELFRRVLSAPVNLYFDITPVGRILNRFSNDLDQMDANLPQQYYNLLLSMSVFLGSLVVCGMASYWVVVSYVPMMIIFVVTGLYFKKTSREIKRLEGVTRTPVFNLFGETLNGLHTIRAFGMQDKFKELNKDVVDTNASFYFMYWAAGRWLAVRLDWLSVVIIFVVSLYLVIAKGQLSPVLSGITITYSLMLTSMVQWVVRALDMTDNAMTSVERLLHFRNIPVEVDPPNAIAVTKASWPSQGAICFAGLCLKYRPELPLVLRGVNMTIQGGEKVGICGRTGAGKSSLMIALFRICDFDAGTIFIDDVDITALKLRDLRSSLAIIPQDPVLYSGSLRENLDPFQEYDDDAIWTVLRQVHLADSVNKWGAGLDFVVSEKGDNLSVGQRQLLCIGRALLKDSKIVVLDEATANVDTTTDSLIQETIKETFEAKTVLIIAHRINTIMHCDKIAVMDAGRVAEFGTPSDLLSRTDSIFASLAKRSLEKRDSVRATHVLP
ncbi:TPA: hypothetical protein N0F65_002130 [Lagenidium giganteum]|uniref:Uncharacterized protein n=1 Tax=Lagenidium giganteum TaxID=4803 RepID=A0AAV2ZHV0_9STRA|nr:TPA: hypothetical protein N0F65_002130 [Lagenidium giganteum]